LRRSRFDLYQSATMLIIISEFSMNFVREKRVAEFGCQCGFSAPKFGCQEPRYSATKQLINKTFWALRGLSRGRKRCFPLSSAESAHRRYAAGRFVVHVVQHVAHPPVKLEDWPDNDHRSRRVFVTRSLGREPLARLFAGSTAVDQ